MGKRSRGTISDGYFVVLKTATITTGLGRRNGRMTDRIDRGSTTASFVLEKNPEQDANLMALGNIKHDSSEADITKREC